VRTVANRTGVTIVQHPGERGHAFNTVRLAQLALERVNVQIAWRGTVERPELPPRTAVLYPGPQAQDLAELPEGERPEHLVVLDGTWPQARVLYRTNPWLQALPHVSLAPARPSAYAIRREPALHCLSTIESIGAALALCEPETQGLDGLLAGFTEMIRGQLERRALGGGEPRHVRRARPSQAKQLAIRWDDVVVLYAETTPPRGKLDGERPELVQLTAVRPATGEVFDCLTRPLHAPHPTELIAMRLGANALDDALCRDELAAAWARFRRDADLLVGWRWLDAEALLGELGDTSPVVCLRALYGNVHKGASGYPIEVLKREGLTAVPVPTRGRSSDRLGISSAIAAWLRPTGD